MIGLIMIAVLTILVVFELVWRNITAYRDGLLANVEMSARIKADLLSELGAKGTHVDCAKRVVTLSGNVPYADFREVAGHLARRRGARQVINELEVVPSAPGRPSPYLQSLPGETTPAFALAVKLPLALDQRVPETLKADRR